MTTNELLQRYVANRSETAFAELVARHIDLVYSAALRRVNGNAAIAQDVTQAVFTELARSAPKLVGHASITGWLYTSTHYLAANAIRSEQRRRTHEQEASVMNQLLNAGESNPIWNELRPSLDEAMLQLSAADREAVLLRYFERLPLAQVGAKLGVSELAARKRVERSLEKLHSILSRRGITSTVAALAILLTERAVAAAPSGLAAQVSAGALAATAGVGGLGWALLKLVAFLTPKTMIAAGAAAVILAVAAETKLTSDGPAQPAPTKAVAATPAGGAVTPNAAPSTVADNNSLTLHIVADDTGQPVPGAHLEYSYSTGPRGAHATESAAADEQGVCVLPDVRKVRGTLQLTTTTEGYADWVYHWRTDLPDGQIPRQYTIRLHPPVPIAGQVVNEAGQPVSGAEVRVAFTKPIKPGEVTETPGFLAAPQANGTATTDDRGHWSMTRFGTEALTNRAVIFGANQSGYMTNRMIGSGRTNADDQKAIEQMLAGNYVYVLRRGYSVHGSVVDSAGNKVPGALLSDVAQLDGNSSSPNGNWGAQTTSLPDGSFALTNMTAINNKTLKIRAAADGFAQMDTEVNVTNSQDPLVITLQPGHLLRLKVTDAQGAPVTNYVVVIHKNRYPVGGSIAPGGGDEYVARIGRGQMLDVPLDIDTDGRLEWDAAPDGDLSLMIMPPGFANLETMIQADGTEHSITLPPQRHQVISGTVEDAISHHPIDRFTDDLLVTVRGRNGVIATITAFRSSFNGKFQGDAADMLHNALATQIRIEADGYAPGLSRVIATNETNVTLDFALMPASFTPLTVLTPDGKPAAHVDIGFFLPWRTVAWAPTGLYKPPVRSTVFSTDDNGQFQLPNDDAILRVAAASADGYAVAERASLTSTPTLQLQPVGRIEGIFLVDDKPAAGHQISLVGTEKDQWNYDGFTSTTDAAGHFIFPWVPPGKVNVSFSRPKGAVPSAGPIAVHGGQTSTVSLHAYTMNLRIKWPQGITRDPRWQMQVYAISDGASSLPIDLVEGAENIWTAQDLPTGDYILYANVGMPAGANPNLMGQLFYNGKSTVVIPDNGESGSAILSLQPVQ